MTAASRLVATQKLFANNQIQFLGVSNTAAGAGNTTNTTPQSLRDFSIFAVIAEVIKPSNSGNSGLVQLDIYASSDANGTVNPTLIATTGTIAGYTAADYAVLEVSEQEIIQACDLASLDTAAATLTAEALINSNGANENTPNDAVEYGLPYVFARLTTTTNADLVGVVTIGAYAKAPALNLTASVLV
jgi:hypothetical protein